MKHFFKASLILLALSATNAAIAQKVAVSTWEPGTPCVSCPSGGPTAKGANPTVQNGNQSNATSYTTTACGLNYTQATVRLGKRGSLAGITQPAPFVISGIPSCATIVKAFIYADASGNGATFNVSVTNPLLASASLPATVIGSGPDKCWGYTGTYSYRVDATAICSGNGTYTISGFPTGSPNDIDGATLLVIYADPTQTYTGHLVIADGAHEASGGTISDVMNGFVSCANSTFANAFVMVGDLQKIQNTPINMNSATSNNTELLANDDWWNFIPGVSPMVTAGQTTATFGMTNTGDCYNLVACGLYWRTTCNTCVPPGNLTVTAVTTSSCSAGSATANVVGGTGPYTYTWSPAGGNAASISSMPTGIYTVTVKDATGCGNGTATVSVSSNPSPTITVAGNNTICIGQAATITASGALSYTWAPSPSLNTTSGPVVTGNPAATTVYSVSGTNSVGCVSTITTNIIVNPLPVITVNNPTLCANQTISLTATGGTGYAWSGPLSFVSAVQNPTIPNSTVPMSGAYNVTVTSAAGCSNTAVASVSVIALPVPVINSNSPVCVGGTLTLQGSGGLVYGWNGPGLISALQNPTIPGVTLANNGTYTLLVSSGTCTALTTQSITINPLPNPIINSNSPVCIGKPILFTGSGGVGYSWNGPGLSSTSQNPVIPVSTMANNGTFTLVVTDANNCVNSITQNFVVNPQPTVTATGTTVCQNAGTYLMAGGGSTYSWTGPGGYTSTQQNPSLTNVQPSMSGQYVVLVTDINTCTNTAIANLLVTPQPIANVQTNAPICIDNILSLVATGGVSYVWSGPNGFFSVVDSPTITANTTDYSGVYNVTVTDANGCFAFATTTVLINPVPTVIITASKNTGCTPICVTYTTTASAPIQTYNWQLGNGATGSTSSEQACYTTPGIYTVTSAITDVNGCSNVATYTAEAYPIPVADFNYAPIKPIEGDEVLFTDASYAASVAGWSWFFMNTAQYTSSEQNP
ncbi:MAG: PKD domain-containing protein, partial [Bacteroidia bacterium]